MYGLVGSKMNELIMYSHYCTFMLEFDAIILVLTFSSRIKIASINQSIWVYFDWNVTEICSRPVKRRKHDDVINWKLVPVNCPHKGLWHAALIFSLICVWINGWGNNREAGDLRRCRVHYGDIVMSFGWSSSLALNMHQAVALTNANWRQNHTKLLYLNHNSTHIWEYGTLRRLW